MFGGWIFDRKVKMAIYILSLMAGVAIVLLGYLTFSISYYFHSYVGFAISTSLLVPSLIVHMENRRRTLIDNMLPRLLDDIAESQDAGMTLLEALEASSKREYGPITEELRKLTAELSWGVEFEEAFSAFSRRIGTDLSAKTTTLILEAIRLGGNLKVTFRSTAEFVRGIIRLRQERESQLRPFLMVIYVSCMIFLLIMLILYQSFFLPMATQKTRFLRLPMSLEGYKSLLFDLSIVEAVFGGLIAGKLSQGTALNGIKHSVILNIIATLIFTVLI